MDPITLMILASAVAGAAQGTIESAPVLINTKYDKFNNSRISDLEALRAAGLLGMEDDAKRAYMAQQLSQVSKSIQDVAPIVGAGTDSGQKALRDLALQRATVSLRTDAVTEANRRLKEMDRAKQQAQLNELSTRLETQDQRQREKVAGAMNIAGNTVGATLGAASYGNTVGGMTTVGKDGVIISGPDDYLNDLDPETRALLSEGTFYA